MTEVPDAQRDEKIREGCEVYASAAERATRSERTISMDELTGVQALERKGKQLRSWMEEANQSAIPELKSFVAGIERDYDAVKAGLTLIWSQGPVEGAVNKIKTHKRLMYGRASFPLLRQKMLHQVGSK